jgi:hypothetical protein
LHPAWILPQITTIILLITGLAYTSLTTKMFPALVFGFSLAEAFAQLFLLTEWIRMVTGRISSKSDTSPPEPLSSSAYQPEDKTLSIGD